MKKVLSILMIIALLVGNVGFVANYHYCGGHLQKKEYAFLSNPDAGCGMEMDQASCESQYNLHAQCCDNAFSQHKIEGQYVASHFELNHAVLISFLPSIIHLTINTSENTEQVFEEHFSPPKEHLSRLADFQSFLL